MTRKRLKPSGGAAIDSLARTESKEAVKEDGPRFLLRLCDNKTRQRDSVPSEKDSSPARMQLMTYRRLLVDLISPSFLWSDLWERLRVNPLQDLPDEFLEQVRPLIGSTRGVRQSTGSYYDKLPGNLNALAHAWREAIARLRIADVERTLRIVYRRRRNESEQKIIDQNIDTLKREIEEMLMQEEGADRDLARQIAAFNVEFDPQFALKMLDKATSAGPLPNDGNSQLDSIRRITLRQAFSVENDSRVIATKRFQYDDNVLRSHVSSILAYWRGHRKPLGVKVEDTGRCKSVPCPPVLGTGSQRLLSQSLRIWGLVRVARTNGTKAHHRVQFQE